MTTLSISLPESMRAYVEQKVAEGGYSTASEYIGQLIRQDQKRAAHERVDALLIEGLESEGRIEVSDDWWEQKKAKLLAKLDEGRSS
jgi:antitoxin ParD1/3/4